MQTLHFVRANFFLRYFDSLCILVKYFDRLGILPIIMSAEVFLKEKMNWAERSYILSVLTLLVIPIVVHIWRTNPGDFAPSLTDTLWHVPFTMLVSYIFDILSNFCFVQILQRTHMRALLALLADTANADHRDSSEKITSLKMTPAVSLCCWWMDCVVPLAVTSYVASYICHQLCCQHVPTQLRSGCCNIQLFAEFFRAAT